MRELLCESERDGDQFGFLCRFFSSLINGDNDSLPMHV